MVDLIAASATPPEVWHRWLADRPLPALSLDLCRRMVVIGAHPDDETIGAGGLIARAAAQVEVPLETTVVTLSDGEASHPDSRTATAEELRRRRTDEQVAALTALGLSTPAERLHLPDGHLESYVAAATSLLVPLLRRASALDEGTWVLAPWRGDGQPDHEAAGHAAAAAAAKVGARLVEYPVWAWHWAAPDDGRLPWDRARAVPLEAPAPERKRTALAAYASQVSALSDCLGDEAVVPESLQQAVLGAAEVVFV